MKTISTIHNEKLHAFENTSISKSGLYCILVSGYFCSDSIIVCFSLVKYVSISQTLYIYLLNCENIRYYENPSGNFQSPRHFIHQQYYKYLTEGAMEYKRGHLHECVTFFFFCENCQIAFGGISEHDKDAGDHAHLLHCLPIRKTQTSQRFCTDLERSLATHSFCLEGILWASQEW